MKAADIPSECIEDPRFTKVLAASLCSEIAESKVILTETNTAIQQLKESVNEAWKKRKNLKQSIQEFSQKKQVLNAALESLMRETKNRWIEIETAKNRMDDATLREIEDRSKFTKIIENYRDTWQRYKLQYEELPLAVERRQCCINMKQLTVQHMIIEYKRKELEKMTRQREKIDAMRIKVSLVELSEIILQRWKDDKYLDNLKSITREISEQLQTYTRQLTEVQQEVKRKKLAESDDMTKMPPPRLDFPFMRSIISHNAVERTPLQPRRSRILSDYRGNKNLQEELADTSSVNSLMFEEMCTDDDYDTNDVMKNSYKIDKIRESSQTKNNVSSTIRQSEIIASTTNNPRRFVERTMTNSNLPSIDEPTDKIRNVLRRLGIEKDKVPSIRSQEESTKRAMNSEKSKKINENDDNSNEKNDQIDDTDVPKDLPTRRTFHSPKDRVDEPEIINEGSRIDRNEEQEMSCSRNLVDVLEIRSSPVPTARQPKKHKPEMEMSKNREEMCNSPAMVESSMSKRVNEKIVDVAQRETPKIRKIEIVDASSIFETLESEQLAPKFNSQRSTSRTNLSSAFRSYVPSCVGSDNWSNIADEQWRELPQGNNEVVAEFSALPNWENWSPPQQHSEFSFASSSCIGGDKNNPETEKRGQSEPLKRPAAADKPNDNSQIDFFFKPTTRDPKSSFL